MSQEIIEHIRGLEREKGIEENTVVQALEDALLAAYKKTPGAARHAEVLDELVFHLRRVDEDAIGEPVLDAQREAIAPRVVAVPLARIDVVGGERDPLAEQLVVEHQQRAIEELELVVPQDVEDLLLPVPPRCPGENLDLEHLQKLE